MKFSYSEFASRVNIRVTSRKVTALSGRAANMTNRVPSKDVVISDVKSIDGPCINALPNSLRAK